MDALKLSHQIKNLREKLNLSQNRFGRKIGLSGKTISSYETGRAIPPVKVLNAISKAYNIGVLSGTYVSSGSSSVFDRVKDIQEKLDTLYEDLRSGFVLS